jgi:hypothetical protein
MKAEGRGQRAEGFNPVRDFYLKSRFSESDLVLHDLVAQLEGGKELKLVQRQTGIWEERGNWVIIHEHLSALSSLQ